MVGDGTWWLLLLEKWGAACQEDKWGRDGDVEREKLGHKYVTASRDKRASRAGFSERLGEFASDFQVAFRNWKMPLNSPEQFTAYNTAYCLQVTMKPSVLYKMVVSYLGLIHDLIVWNTKNHDDNNYG